MTKAPIIREWELEINKEEAKILDKAMEVLNELKRQSGNDDWQRPVEKGEVEIINEAYTTFQTLCARLSIDCILGK